MVSSSDANWNYNGPEHIWESDHFLICVKVGLKAAQQKVISYAQVSAISQEPNENIIAFLERLKEALQKFTNLDLDSYEGQMILKDKFLSQCAFLIEDVLKHLSLFRANYFYQPPSKTTPKWERPCMDVLMKVKMESEKVGLKPNIQKTRIMASSPITSWEIDGETVETVSDFIFLGSKITADGDCSHEIKRRLLLGRKVMNNLDSTFKSRDITLPTKVRLVKAMVFPVVMYGCESWTVKKAEH